MFSVILLNLIWSKNWNVIVQQVSYLQLVLRLNKIRKATLKTLETNTVILSNFYIFWYAFKVKINVPKEKLTWSKFNQKMIPISWVVDSLCFISVFCICCRQILISKGHFFLKPHARSKERFINRIIILPFHNLINHNFLNQYVFNWRRMKMQKPKSVCFQLKKDENAKSLLICHLEIPPVQLLIQSSRGATDHQFFWIICTWIF